MGGLSFEWYFLDQFRTAPGQICGEHVLQNSEISYPTARDLWEKPHLDAINVTCMQLHTRDRSRTILSWKYLVQRGKPLASDHYVLVNCLNGTSMG